MTDKPITLPPLPKKTSLWNVPEVNGYTADHMNEFARAAVLADRALNATAQGMVLVPMEPTEAMKDAAVTAYQAWLAAEKPWSTFEHSDSYRAMLAAAPTAPIPAVDAVAGEPVARLRSEGDGGAVVIDQIYRPLSVGTWDVYVAPVSGSGADWRHFGLTVAAALDRGDDPALLFDGNSPIRDEIRRLLAATTASASVQRLLPGVSG